MNPDVIPAELREYDHWVGWRLEDRNGKPSKVPYQARAPRKLASSTDPQTWGTFKQAMAIKNVDGIGYAFAADDPFAGVDLDKCINPTTGELHPAANEIIEQLDSYWERSPSGTGVHVIVKAELHTDRHSTADTDWGAEFAVYDNGRYFTITGNGHGLINERQAELDALVQRMFASDWSNGAGEMPGGRIREVLDRHEDLAKIVARKGSKPADGTGHAWDFYLCCEAIRCGCADVELAALIIHIGRSTPTQAARAYATTTSSARSRRLARRCPQADPPAPTPSGTRSGRHSAGDTASATPTRSSADA
jgi:hypothetical protein